MSKILVKTKSKHYPILLQQNVEKEVLTFLLEQKSKWALVTNKTISRLYQPFLKKLSSRLKQNLEIFLLPDGEKYKTLESLNAIYTFLLKKGLDRKSGLIAFGGGVIGDMVGFAASSFMRGIKFVQIPTTLLAMVDSSIGGKVAINHPLGKNMIGQFYQPECIFMGLHFLKTLSMNEFKNGLAEVIKHGMICDARYFNYLEKNLDFILKMKSYSLMETIKRSCEIKADVVRQDEKESGIREILNYGHTFGHVLETVTDYQYFKHGEAVIQGMRAEAFLAERIHGFPSAHRQRQDTLLNRVGLKIVPRLSSSRLMKAIERDKKSVAGEITCVLPSQIGKVERICEIDKKCLRQTFNYILKN